MPEACKDTIVGHDVWIGQGAIILPGARIASGVIIGAGSVVGGAVPDYAIMSGNPAQGSRMRGDAATIAKLLDIAWWDWPIDHIRAHEQAIVGRDIAALLEAGQALN